MHWPSGIPGFVAHGRTLTAHQYPSSSPPESCLCTAWTPGKLLYFCMQSKMNSHRRNVGPKLFCGICPLSAKSAFYLKTQCKPQSWLFKGLCDKRWHLVQRLCDSRSSAFAWAYCLKWKQRWTAIQVQPGKFSCPPAIFRSISSAHPLALQRSEMSVTVGLLMWEPSDFPRSPCSNS